MGDLSWLADAECCHWFVPADSAEELAALQQQQAALDIRRAHNRRQRQRQSQRLVDSVGQLLSGLRQPFGEAAQQLYQPLLQQQACEQLQCLAAAHAAPADCLGNTSSSTSTMSSSSSLPPRLEQSLRWPVLQQTLQRQQQQPPASTGPIQLASAASIAHVEQQLLLDWSQVPPLLDPAFGGRLADADVVRAGKGKMNLRALRKRVQVCTQC